MLGQRCRRWTKTEQTLPQWQANFRPFTHLLLVAEQMKRVLISGTVDEQ